MNHDPECRRQDPAAEASGTACKGRCGGIVNPTNKPRTYPYCCGACSGRARSRGATPSAATQPPRPGILRGFK
jgi:hypothetical protein